MGASKRFSVRSQSSGKEVTKDPASLQKEIDTRMTKTAVIGAQSFQVWTNRSGWISIKAESQATSDRVVIFPVVKQRQTSSPVEFPQVPIIEMEFEDPDRDG